jgi:hypothetical protein
MNGTELACCYRNVVDLCQYAAAIVILSDTTKGVKCDLQRPVSSLPSASCRHANERNHGAGASLSSSIGMAEQPYSYLYGYRY